MKKWFLTTALFVSFIVAKAQSYTWAESAACIFYSNCTSCHFPNGPGPFSLIDYASAYSNRFAIRQAILDNYMPPWAPDENYQTYAHERLISQQEKDILVAWVDQGAAEGNIANSPIPPTYNASGSQLSQIDFTGGVGYYSNAALSDDYRCFLIPTHLGVDKYIEAIEFIGGTKTMTHHALIYYETDTNTLLGYDAADPGMGYTNFGGTGLSTSKLICTWTPGSDVLEYPTGMGVKLPANAYLVIQIHYPQSSIGDIDSNSIVNLKFATGLVREVSLDPILHYLLPGSISPYPLYVGANSTASFVETYTLPNVTPFADNFTILNVLPHMHQVGVSIKAYAVKPGNDTVPLIDIPDWDFEWQGQYSFRKPMVFPEGTILVAEATYDNTSANTDAPNYTLPVPAGESSDEEMMLVYFSYLYAMPGDENIIVDTVTVVPTYNGCSFLDIDAIDNLYTHLSIYPNPVSEIVNVSFQQFTEGDVQITLFDLTGKILLQYNQPKVGVGNFTKTLNLQTISAGMYNIRIFNGSQLYTKSLIVTK